MQADGLELDRTVEVLLENDWQHAELDVAHIIEPAFGVEVDYWKGKQLSCRQLSETIMKRYLTQPDNIRTVLILNNTMYMFTPNQQPFGNGSVPYGAVNGTTRYDWPDLLPAAYGSCVHCHGYLHSFQRHVSQFLMARTRTHNYTVPPILFMVNTADNMQRWGKGMPAPLLSLQKRWQVPWHPSNASTTSLGRIHGRLLNDTQMGTQPGSDYVPVAQASGLGPEGSEGRTWQEVLQALLARPAGLPPAVADDPTQANWDPDLMIPQVKDVPTHLYFHNWQHKDDVGFFSGTPHCPQYGDPFGGVCQRLYMAALSLLHPEDLKVQLVTPHKGRLGTAERLRHVDLEFTPFNHSSMKEHAAYRYLLQLDGMSHAYRMTFLMGINSPMLKARSPNIEWVSRLQVPGAHYREFWLAHPNDVLGALQETRHAAATDPDAMWQAVKANQLITARYAGVLPRMLYMRAVFYAYSALFTDMDECIGDFLQHLTAMKRPLPAVPSLGRHMQH